MAQHAALQPTVAIQAGSPRSRHCRTAACMKQHLASNPGLAHALRAHAQRCAAASTLLAPPGGRISSSPVTKPLVLLPSPFPCRGFSYYAAVLEPIVDALNLVLHNESDAWLSLQVGTADAI